jgi:proteasome lid subunit RPN8/RPN11
VVGGHWEAPVLNLSAEADAAIRAHAEEGYPLEICGFLVGDVGPEGRVVRHAWPVRNTWETDPELRAHMLEAMEKTGTAGLERWQEASEERRFMIAPLDTLQSMKRARQEGMDLVGVYHTHPNHPAVPSDFDRDAAQPEWSYIIASVRDGRVAELRSWALDGEDGPFVEESISLAPLRGEL